MTLRYSLHLIGQFDLFFHNGRGNLKLTVCSFICRLHTAMTRVSEVLELRSLMWIPLEISTRDSAVPVLKFREWLQCAVCEWESERLYTPTVWHQVTATCTRSSLHAYVIYLFSWNASTMLCVACVCFTWFCFVLSLSWAAAFVIMQSSLSAYLECWQHFRLDFTHTCLPVTPLMLLAVLMYSTVPMESQSILRIINKAHQLAL